MSDLSQVEKNKNLLIYVKNENINEIKNAIEDGADVNYTTRQGYTPLYESVGTGNKKIVSILIEAGAKIDVDGDEYNGPPLVYAARTGNVEIMKLLIEKGGNINIQHKKDRSFDTPLHAASKNEKDKAIEFLVDREADLTIKNNFKKPLDIIAEKYVEVPDKAIRQHQKSVDIQVESKSKQEYINRSKGYLQDSIERKKKGMKFITSIIKKAFNKKIPLEQISTNPIVKEIYDKFKRVNKYRKDTVSEIAKKEELSEDVERLINSNFDGKGGKRKTKKLKGGKRSIPRKYVPKRLSKKDKKKQLREIKKSRKAYKNRQYHTRKKVKSFKSKKSAHILNAEKIYKVKNVRPGNELAKKTGCSVGALRKIVKKGQGAYFSSGSRPNQTAHSWGYARLASSITGGKSAAVDFKVLSKGCKKTGKAYKLALKSKKKHGFGTRKVSKF